MATKFRITPAQRFAVWQTHQGMCYWCGEPLSFVDTTVDHVIPELYESRPDDLREIVDYYGLDSSFAINGFGNWVPAHQRCNRSKGTTLFPRSPAMLALLMDVARVAPAAQANHDRVIVDQKKSRILGRVAAAVFTGVITMEDLLTLFQGLEFPRKPVPVPTPPGIPPVTQLRAPDLESLALRVAPGWTIVSRSFDLVNVTDGQRFGTTTAAERPDASWMCPHCGNYGPWNGVICMSCMRISDPAD